MSRTLLATSNTSGFKACRRRKGEELAGQLGRAVGRVCDGVEIPPTAVFGDVRAAKQVDRAADDGQQVVEVVGHTAGELSDRLDLLRLSQLLLGLHQLGRPFGDTLLQRLVEQTQRGGSPIALGFDDTPRFHVEEDPGEVERRPVRRMLDLAVRLDPVVAAVGTAHPVLMGIGAAALDRLGDRGCESLLIVRVHRRDDLLEA